MTDALAPLAALVKVLSQAGLGTARKEGNTVFQELIAGHQLYAGIVAGLIGAAAFPERSLAFFSS